jgi:hypothetical protein
MYIRVEYTTTKDGLHQRETEIGEERSHWLNTG